jgi:ABC-type cobalamin/Fe3+-siderophores transport system ATPase subunit
MMLQSGPTGRIGEIRDISKTLGARKAFRGLPFNVPAREIRALIGENSGEKSTSIKMPGAIAPNPESEILIRGQPVAVAVPIAAKALGNCHHVSGAFSPSAWARARVIGAIRIRLPPKATGSNSDGIMRLR